ncbi:hypothetical protein DFP72DRAFT_840505 [Ephemerocybe angulata]|uniref:Uncharacterized protein n=1 Tax=Ephemerocybe angulata TaxID=980116 RepID=A0A8H6IFD9_9AGAR|nr:hypothetical protein DFP72DRAFT_840505 [Tulosesus angulatus]
MCSERPSPYPVLLLFAQSLVTVLVASLVPGSCLPFSNRATVAFGATNILAFCLSPRPSLSPLATRPASRNALLTARHLVKSASPIARKTPLAMSSSGCSEWRMGRQGNAMGQGTVLRVPGQRAAQVCLSLTPCIAALEYMLIPGAIPIEALAGLGPQCTCTQARTQPGLNNSETTRWFRRLCALEHLAYPSPLPSSRRADRARAAHPGPLTRGRLGISTRRVFNTTPDPSRYGCMESDEFRRVGLRPPTRRTMRLCTKTDESNAICPSTNTTTQDLWIQRSTS